MPDRTSIRTAPLPVCDLDNLDLLRNRIAVYASMGPDMRCRLEQRQRQTNESFRRMGANGGAVRMSRRKPRPAAPPMDEGASLVRPFLILIGSGSRATHLRLAGLPYCTGSLWLSGRQSLPASFVPAVRDYLSKMEPT